MEFGTSASERVPANNPVRVRPPLPAYKEHPADAVFGVLRGFLFGMKKLLKWILECGNGEYIGRRDLISEGVTVDVLECGSVRPSATFLDVGIGDVEVMEIGRMEVAERVKAVRRYAQIALTFPEPVADL